MPIRGGGGLQGLLRPCDLWNNDSKTDWDKIDITANNGLVARCGWFMALM